MAIIYYKKPHLIKYNYYEKQRTIKKTRNPNQTNGTPSVGDVMVHPSFFVFLQKVFWRISGKVDRYEITRNPNKQMAGLVPLVCT